MLSLERVAFLLVSSVEIMQSPENLAFPLLATTARLKPVMVVARLREKMAKPMPGQTGGRK